MNTITLNIGLEVSDNYLPDEVDAIQLKYEYVKDYLEEVIGKPMQILLARSATEQTVVVQYSNVEAVLKKLFWLAYVLKQDCIAYSIQDANGVVLGGALVGEYAHEWNFGIFSANYFLPM